MTQKRLWFKVKHYGWGWYPATWEGWTVLGVYIAWAMTLFYLIDSISHSVSDTLINFVPQLIMLSVMLLVVCYKKGEKPTWRWGKKKS